MRNVPSASLSLILSVAAAQEPVVQVHDLRTITAPLPGLAGRWDEPRLMLPVGPVLGDGSQVVGTDGGRLATLPLMVPRLTAQEVLDRLEPLWSGEQGAASLLDNQLRLRAPNDVQAAVRDVLALFAAIRQQSHRVTLYELPPGAGADQRALLEPKEVEALLAAAPPLRATASTVPVDVPWLWESGRTTSYVRDFDVEVAETSSISDPKMGTFFTGTRLGLCLSPLIDGRVLARAALQSTAAQGAPAERKLTARGLGTLQLPEVDALEACATAALHPGGGILLSGDRDRGVWLLRVEPAVLPPLQFGAASGLPLGGLAVARVAAARSVDPIRRPEEGEPQRAESDAPDALGALDQLLGGGLGDDRGRVRTFGSHVVLIGQTALRARVEQELQKQAALLRTTSIAFKVGKVPTELALRHIAGRARADELAAALPAGGTIATLLGYPFALTLGREQAFVRDYEVEIAKEATAANPIVDTAFRGFQLRGVVHATAGGAPQITLRLQWSDLATMASVDFANADLGAVDGPVTAWTDVEQPLPVRNGEWLPFHIEPDPKDPASGTLVCMVRVD